MNTPIYNYPTKEETDPNVLLQNLGSFWNYIFEEKATLKGYTLGLAEEVIQSYLGLIDTVATYSVGNCPTLRRENWYPLIVKKSEYRKAAFIFQPNDAVFGPQPESGRFYAGAIFKFGYPKTTDRNVYAVQIPESFKEFSIIANRVINPSLTFIHGIDVIKQDNALYFNEDLFLNPLIPKAKIVGENGVVQTYVESGVTYDDELIVLWVYGLLQDNRDLDANFGFIYGLTQESTEVYKKILDSIVNICIDGPTVKAFKFALASFYGIPVVIEPEEEVEQILTTQFHKVVVTNKNSYKYPLYTNVLPTVTVDSKVYSGDVLVDAIKYYDTSVLPNWYETVFDDKATVPFSSHVFLGNYQFQLFFSTSVELITLSLADELHFPVEGTAEDVATFQEYINETNNKAVIKQKLGLSTTGSRSVSIVPCNWVFDNFFKNNTALVKLNFSTADLTADFFDYLTLLKQLLPAHVYVIFDFSLGLPTEVYDNLNSSYTITAYPGQLFNSDGTNLNGYIPNIAPYYYKSLTERMFVIGFSPLLNGAPLSDFANLDQCVCNSSGDAGKANVIVGKVFNNIPANATTREVRELKLIDYSSPYT